MTPENSYMFRKYIHCKECRRTNSTKWQKANLHSLPPELRWPKKIHCVHGHELTLENTFQRFRKGKKDGRKCIQCSHDEHKRFRKKYPDVMYRGRIKSQNGIRYGRDYDRDAQLASQGGACALCGITSLTWGKGFTKVWHTDHEHGREGTHRGVLCGACNTALGRIEPLWDKVTSYLAKYARGTGDSKETT
jgi:hypothetical protein